MNVINAIEGLQLNRLDPDYIESVWSQEFMGEARLSRELSEYYNSNGIEILEEVMTAVDSWQLGNVSLQQGNEDIQVKSWKHLMEFKLNTKAFLSVLGYLISNGQCNKNNETLRQLSLKASNLYLKLLSVPGSRVYHAFHPYLCLKAVSVLKLSNLIAIKQNKKGKKRMVDELFSNNTTQLRTHEATSLLDDTIKIVQTLQFFVTKFSLETQQELLEEIVERLCEITRLEINTANFMNYRSLNTSHLEVTLSSLAYNAYECLRFICSSHHGEIEDTIIVILKHLLPGVLFADHDLSFREQCIIREHTVHFIKFLLFTMKEAAYRGVTILLQHVFTRIGEKAETRQKGKETLVDIIKVVPYKQYSDLVRWLFDCAHSDRASHRLLALEVIAQLLNEEPHIQRLPGQSTDSELISENDSSSSENASVEEPKRQMDKRRLQPTVLLTRIDDVRLHKFMLAVMFARCRDSSAVVRAKALSLLVQCMKTENMVVRSLMNEIFVLNYQEHDSDIGFLKYNQIIKILKGNNPNVNPLPVAGVIIAEFKKLACDSKVNVRKAALQALENIMRLNRSWLSGSIIKMLGSSCRDPAVSIRKEMVQVLTDLLQQYPDDKELSQIWAKSVVPLVLDQEGKLQECVLKVMRLMIMDNLTEYSSRQDDIWYALAWQLLKHVVKFNLHVCFMKACELWVKEKEIRNSLIKDLCTHIGTENNVAAWTVLYCLSSQIELKNPLFAVNYYQQEVASNEEEIVSLLVIVLEVLLSCSSHLPRHVQKDVLNEFVDSLLNFNVHRKLIRLNVEIAVELTYELAECRREAKKNVKAWTSELLQQSQIYLQNAFQPDATKALEEDQFLRHLHTFGEVAMHNPTQVNEKIFQLLQRFLFVPGDGMNISTSSTAKALAVVAVGKLCVLNQMWAKQSIKPLMKLRKSTQDMPTVMNIMYVLRDLCVRYGAMMEPYLPSLWICLKDVTVEVRLTALSCLVELLQGNYVKFRGSLFFHILSMLCDGDDNVVEVATYYLRDCLAVSNKTIMCEHFIDAIFHYNGYSGHEIYGKCSMSREERELFLMKGDEFQEEREKLYEFMLENMSDEQRMLCKKNLVKRILDGAAEGHVRLDEDGENVVLDAIHILNSKNIHMRVLQQGGEDDATAEETDKITNQLAKTTNKKIEELIKKDLVEYVVPVVIHLKAVLQEKYSRLVPHLMLYLRDTMKEYKNEIRTIFAEDKLTATEILSDIDELDNRQKHPENVQRREDNTLPRTSENIPDRISMLLQSASPWVRQNLSPEISRCYRAGGDVLMIKYARAKLRHIRRHSYRRSGHSRSRGHPVVEVDDFIQEPKQESTSEHGGDYGDPYVDFRDQDYDSHDENLEENLQIGETEEENLQIGETEEQETEGEDSQVTESEGEQEIEENLEEDCQETETLEENENEEEQLVTGNSAEEEFIERPNSGGSNELCNVDRESEREEEEEEEENIFYSREEAKQQHKSNQYKCKEVNKRKCVSELPSTSNVKKRKVEHLDRTLNTRGKINVSDRTVIHSKAGHSRTSEER